jgi:serine/threonine protein kinase/tetratricopeptide (TPR) repeat protein
VPVKCPECNTDNPSDSKYCKECATQLPVEEVSVPTETLEAPKEELTTGSTFAGRYQIIEELGKGGMGKVYKALDKEIDGRVALKLIKPEIAADEKTINRFRNELKIARDIAHKNVCRMYHLAKYEGTHYIVMEYVSGEDLKSFIRRSRQLTPGTAISIAKQVCEGLAEAHKLGTVHRDLKPQNIMIDKDGNARIMDFGIARSLKEKGITGAGVMIGTPEYMSPEQVEGKEIDQRSDIYSLGVILYEMVTGRVPFEAETPFAVGMKHKSETPQDPLELNSQIPADLSRVILRCLEKDKEKRYQNADELHAELSNIEKGIPTTERIVPERRPTTSREITVTFRRRWVLVAALVGVVIIAALVFLFLKVGKQVTPVTPTANKLLVVLPFENLGPPEDEYFADGITDEVTNRLSALHGLDVISRTSAIQYKKTNKTIQQIQKELNVDFVLAGTVRWDKTAGEKGRVRVSPQLIRAADDTQLWFETYERDIENIFGVQSGIAEQVIKQLDITILEPERKALTARPTENLEAYDYYLKGREHQTKAITSLTEEEEYIRAIEMYERAIELDPDIVTAYISLSGIHSWMFFAGYDKTKERLAKSKAAVDKALELQPNLPEALEALGYYYYRGFLDYDKALQILESVQKARPNLPLELLGYIKRRQGKWEESLETLERVFKLDPRDSELAMSIGNTNMHMRRYAEADLWFDRSLALSAENFTTKAWKAWNSAHLRGDTQEARAILKTFPPDPFTDVLWFIVDFFDGDYERILERLDSFSVDHYEMQDYFFHKDLAYADAYFALKKSSLMKEHADLARIALEKTVSEHPEDPRYHSALGLAYAYLGRKDEAIREGNQAIKLCPVSKDALSGPGYVIDLLEILIVIGEYESAIEQLEYLMSIPAGGDVSVNSLRKSPMFDSLRDLPRFKRLLEKYSEE